MSIPGAISGPGAPGGKLPPKDVPVARSFANEFEFGPNGLYGTSELNTDECQSVNYLSS